MAWDPPEYRDAKKIRINQAIREWNTPLKDEHRMKMDIINVEEPREYTFTAKDEFNFQLAKTVTNVLFGVFSKGLSSIIMPDFDLRAGDVQVSKKNQYRMRSFGKILIIIKKLHGIMMCTCLAVYMSGILA